MSVVLITNMYPDEYAPYLGTFVRDTVGFFGDRVEIVYPGNSYRNNKLRFYASLYRRAFAKLWDARTVVFHYPLFFSPLIIAARMLGKRVVLVYHGGEIMYRPGQNAFAKLVRRAAFRVNNDCAIRLLVPTCYVASTYFERWKDKVTVWYSGGIELTPLIRSDADRRFVFGYFGRKERVKAFDCYLESLRCLATRSHEGPELHCLSVCRETDVSTKENVGRITIYHLPPISQSEVIDYLRQCTFTVIPSRAESLCLLALEAARCGSIVIARRLKAIEETLGDEVIYFDDDEELVDVLADALALTPVQRRRKVERLQGLLERFDRQKLIEEFRFA